MKLIFHKKDFAFGLLLKERVFITRDAVNLQLILTDFLNECRRRMLLVRSGGWGGLP